MSGELTLEQSPPRAWRIPEPTSSRAIKAVIAAGVLFVVSVALIEYEFVKAHGKAPSGYNLGLIGLLVLPAVALAIWIYASQQTLRTFLLCLFPPVTANTLMWFAFVGGHSQNISPAVTGTLVACVIWLLLLPALGAFANHITARTRVHHPYAPRTVVGADGQTQVIEVPTDRFAIASLILGILGVSIFAILFGCIALHRTNDGQAPGRIYAVVGVTLGLLEAIASAVVLIVLYVHV